MKQGIHPKYDTIKVTCGCGNTFETRSTSGDINVEICSACHPFFTGKQKLVDTAGRVDRFKARLEASAAKKATQVEKKPKTEATPVAEKALEEKLEEIKTELVEETVDTKPAEVAEIGEEATDPAADTEATTES